MVVAGKKVYRVSAQSWASVVSTASHYYGVLTDTETGAEWQSPPYDTEMEALRAATEQWFDCCDCQKSRILVNFPASAMAAL